LAYLTTRRKARVIGGIGHAVQMTKELRMGKLVVLEGGRNSLNEGTNEKLISGLEDLLGRAKSGEMKGLIYASIDRDNQTVSLGILHDPVTMGLHEAIGLSEMLSDSLLQNARD
jgi:hypothetical protein